ncbi:hypothetical protein A1O7_08347 [Cladophialophora yegresii CBS 114405]|uniref:Uncharacterized protein n=1 Tax=Cladophialophora yegresii CBS 114405 TaxID=1182544 RepID=W9VQY8_9EURO|nr:uncharacterized protein A1O7_08347 [Cladophialophora yegresii CBS 114405]EXJ55420.1 hypothetical protein A1O7_08347 [Cladophialophora yegresii CBS 114405]
MSIHKQNEPAANHEEVVAPVPPADDEMRLRSTKGDEGKSCRPSCSTYSKEWRRRGGKMVTPTEQSAGGGPAAVTSVDSDIEFGDRVPVNRLVGAGESSSFEIQGSAVAERQTLGAVSRTLQTNASDQHVQREKNKRKRSPTIRKILCAFKIR